MQLKLYGKKYFDIETSILDFFFLAWLVSQSFSMCTFISDPCVPITSFWGAIFYTFGVFRDTKIGIYYINRGNIAHFEMLPMFLVLRNFIFQKLYLNVLR